MAGPFTIENITTDRIILSRGGIQIRPGKSKILEISDLDIGITLAISLGFATSTPPIPSDAETDAHLASNLDKDPLFSFLGQPGGIPDTGARRITTAPFVLGNGVATAISFSSTQYDKGGFVFSSREYKIPAAQGGAYMVVANAKFNANATGRRSLDIRVNGVVEAEDTRDLVGAINRPTLACSTILDLAPGDIIEMFAFQDSGGVLTVEPFPTHFAIQRMA